MAILGVHCGHNSSAALMVDGRIVGAAQEERFTKRKNQVAFPVRAVKHLLSVHLGSEEWFAAVDIDDQDDFDMAQAIFQINKQRRHA
jgi:carbamoyltransferase